MYEVVRVQDDAPRFLEPIGTKSKFWFRGEDGIDYLFKEGRPNTGENWAEKVACELAELLGIPHAKYELAVWKDNEGVICPTFVPKGARLIHGNEILVKRESTYPVTKIRGVSQHTLRLVLAVMKSPAVKAPIGWQCPYGISSAIDVFIGYLMFDAWIANQDRHHENWALITLEDRSVHLAPSYDHASSLGRNESDSTRNERLTTKDKRRGIERYVERAVSAFYISSNEQKPMHTISAFQEATKASRSAARLWLEKLERISERDQQNVFDQIPRDLITSVAVDFAQRMLNLNRIRLLNLKGALT